MNIYQSNTYRKDLIKLATFWQSARGLREAASEGPTVNHIRFYSLSDISK